MSSKQRKLEIYIDGLNHGGAEHLLLSMLPTLKKRFDSIEILTFKGSFALIRAFSSHVNVQQLSPFEMFWRLWTTDAICYVGLSKSIFLTVLVSTLRKVFLLDRKPYFCHEHTSFHYHTGRAEFSKRIFDMIYKRLILHSLRNKLIAYIISTKARRKELEPWIDGSTDIHLFPNSFAKAAIVQLQESRSTLNKKNPTDKSLRLFTLSRLDPVKQLTWAIDAALGLARKAPELEVILDICGRGPDLDRLQRHATSCADQINLKVRFPGFVESITVPLKESDIFLFPSRVEGFPLSLTEAALSGISCVANNCPHGPADIASYFPNVRLVDPPTLENFVGTTLKVYEACLHQENRDYQTSGSQIWPSIEELTEQLSDFMQKRIHLLDAKKALPLMP
jgi:glycosyltransferase involved in cell wall biosynthesis